MHEPRIAITADWLPTYGGAEHVISALCSVWPHAPVYTTVARPERLPPSLRECIRTVPRLQRLFHVLQRHQLLLPLLPRAMEEWDLSGYDIVLSSSHAVGKGIVPPPHCTHVCYCHTPMRYAWEMEEEYLQDFRLRGWLRKLVKKQLKWMRRWDLSTAKRVDVFIANSRETQERIRRIYGRESVVIHPPVDDRFFLSPIAESSKQDEYFLALGRLVPYKRFDLLIEVANRLRLPLKIGGRGQDEARLKNMAGPTVEFLGFVEDAQLPALYAGAKALLFPQFEDAGVVALEAQACGTPVIAFGRGGAMDTIVDGTTGLLVAEQTADAFQSAIAAFRPNAFDAAVIRAHAGRFSLARFKEQIAETVTTAWSQRKS